MGVGGRKGVPGEGTLELLKWGGGGEAFQTGGAHGGAKWKEGM